MMVDDNVEKKLLAAFNLSSSSESDVEDEEEVEVVEMVMPVLGSRKRVLSKQLSMRETSREAKWEHRRQQIINRRKRMMFQADGGQEEKHETIEESEEERKRRGRVRSLTDEDLDELRGSIELGFGFNEEDGGHSLCNTLPALDLYFAVNRQLSDPKMRFSPSPVSTPTADSSSSSTLCGCGTPSPQSPQDDQWKICNPGDNPQHVKIRLRHWAQAVACSLRQCS